MKKLKEIIFISVIFFIICIFPKSCVKAVGHNAEYDAPEIDLSSTLKEVIQVPVIRNSVCQSFTLINDQIYAANIINGDYEKGHLYLGNFSDGSLIQSSAVDRNGHSNGLTYDSKRNRLAVVMTPTTIYDVDLTNQKIIYNKLLNSRGNAVGYSSSLDKFVRASGGMIRVYKGDDFYNDKQEYQFKIVLEEDLHDAQSGEAFGNYFFYVLTDRLNSEHKISGNTILAINLETKAVEQQLYLGDTSDEFEDCSFDSQGNLYAITALGQVYKTGYNAYAEGLVSASPTNLIEVVANFVTQALNTVTDWIQELLESMETGEDFSQINLTYPASEIMEDESLQSIIQVENIVNENENQSENQSENEEENQNQDQDQDQNNSNQEQLLQNWKIDTEIQSKIDNKNGEEVLVYTAQTPIPTIKVSFDSVNANKLELFDINFLDRSNSNSNIIWNILKNVVDVSAHIVLYLCAVLLLGTIIYRSILLVMATLGYKPERATQSKKIINNLVKAVAIIVSIYVIIQLFINFYNLILGLLVDKLTNGVDTPYLIRTKVNDVYCFNTNIMGYFKYLSMTTDIWGAFGWTLLRVIMTIINLLLCAALGARAIIIGLLIIVAPIVAINELSGRVPTPGNGWRNLLFLRPFITFYLIILWFPILLVLVGLVI